MALAKGARRLRVLALAVALACVIALLLAPGVALATNPKVNFPDKGLNAAVRSAIGKPTGQIYASDLTTLTSLSAEADGIVRLDGLQYATNLTSLDLTDNKITTITPLSKLTKLTSLDLDENRITSSSIGALSKLTKLTGLGLRGDRITTVTALSKLTNLEYLGLDSNKITTIVPLTWLTNLTTLYLWDNYLDLTPGSLTMDVIAAMQARLATVDYTPQDTELSITSNKTAVTRGKTVRFSGTITPQIAKGTPLVLLIRKSGSSTWTTLASPTTSDTRHWSYAYAVPKAQPLGTYYVRVYFAGAGNYLASYSASRKLVITK